MSTAGKKNMKISIYKAGIQILPVLAGIVSFVKYKTEYAGSMEYLYAAYRPEPISFLSLSAMEPQMDLSFIVPVYNAQNFLRKCVDSLIGQKTKYRYEIILIDDGSKDHSFKIAEEYANKYSFITVCHQQNAGISAARNRGIELARGRYLAFVDDDDYVSPEYTEKLLDRAYRKDADMVKCGHYRWDAAKDCPITRTQYEDTSFQGDMGSAILELKGFVWEGISKRSLWKDWRFPKGYWYEDMITRFVLMRRAVQIEVLGDVMYYYCLHGLNASKKIWNHSRLKCLDELYLLQAIMKLSPPDDADIQTVHALLYETGGVLWSRTRRLPSKIKKAVFGAARELIRQYVPEGGISYSDDEKQLIRYYLKGSFLSWQLVSCKQMLRVKLKNDYGR